MAFAHAGRLVRCEFLGIDDAISIQVQVCKRRWGHALGVGKSATQTQREKQARGPSLASVHDSTSSDWE
jgi:hypothetical protein